jgi:outer membrane protein W
MKAVTGLLFVLLFSSLATANHEGERGSSVDHSNRISLGGFYGYAPVTPTDINDIAASKSSNPALGKISTAMTYGGFFGVKIGRGWEIKATYETQEAKNLTSTNLNPNAGYDLVENTIWGSLNYYLFHTDGVYMFLGAGVGQPLYSHVTEQLAAKTEYDADKQMGYMGQVGLGFMLGHHLSLRVEAAYEKITSGTLKTSAGVPLNTPSGSGAAMDLSGVHADGAVVIVL